MTSKQIREVLGETKFKEAHLWHARLNDEHATDQDWLDFAAWLEASEGNSEAYHQVADLSDFITDHRDSMKEEWRNGEDAVSPTAQINDLRPSFAFFGNSKKYLAGIAAVAATFLFVAVGSTYFSAQAPSTQEYVSGYTGPRLVTLSDGSRIHLNVNSKIEVSFDEEERRTTLSYGEVLFDVAKTPGRPFTVEAGGSRIRVLGTTFNVLRHHGDTTVTVSHGIVDVSANASDESTKAFARQRLTAGEQLRYREGSTQTDVSNVDIDAALAWREGRLVYNKTSLSEIAADLNRYFDTQVELEKRVLAYDFSGTLKTDDLDTILLLLEDSLPVKIERTASHIVIGPK